MFVLFKADPIIVNELGPAVVLIQTLPNAASAVAFNVGVNESVVKVCSLP